MSQEELAKIVGITQESLSKAENGKLALSKDVQILIATVLGGSVESLFPETVAP